MGSVLQMGRSCNKIARLLLHDTGTAVIRFYVKNICRRTRMAFRSGIISSQWLECADPSVFLWVVRFKDPVGSVSVIFTVADCQNKQQVLDALSLSSQRKIQWVMADMEGRQELLECDMSAKDGAKLTCLVVYQLSSRFNGDYHQKSLCRAMMGSLNALR